MFRPLSLVDNVESSNIVDISHLMRLLLVNLNTVPNIQPAGNLTTLIISICGRSTEDRLQKFRSLQLTVNLPLDPNFVL